MIAAMKSLRLAPIALLVAVVALAFGAAGAAAAPGAYRIVIVHGSCEPPTKFQAQLKAFPDVAAVDAFGACATTPALGQLTPYDMVVSMSGDGYFDPVAYGNVLADYVDSGGVVFQYAYDSEKGLLPKGRFEEQGYPPYIAGDNTNASVTLGEFDATNPLMQGVTTLASNDNTEPALAPGATLVAKWSDGRNLLAYKGRVISASAYIADGAVWSGDFARLTINGVRWLGRHLLTVSNPTAGGTVTSNPVGIDCGTSCSAAIVHGTPVALAATPNPGFAFAGFTGACTGPICSLTVDADKTVTASFSSFALGKKVTRNRKRGTATLTVNVGGPGQLALVGKKVKPRSRAVAAVGKVKFLIKAKGKAAKALRKRGKAKVRFDVVYTPTGGQSASSGKVVTLRRTLGK